MSYMLWREIRNLMLRQFSDSSWLIAPLFCCLLYFSGSMPAVNTRVLSGVDWNPETSYKLNNIGLSQTREEVVSSGVAASGDRVQGVGRWIFNWKKFDFLSSNLFKVLSQIKEHSIGNSDCFKVHNFYQELPLWLLTPYSKNPAASVVSEKPVNDWLFASGGSRLPWNTSTI